jgi:DNA polymerase I
MVIENLFGERTRYKSLMKKEELDSDNYKLYEMRQRAMKTLLNALYGQTAYVGSRIHDARVAETVTYIGRNLIQWSRQFLEDIDYKVIYIDTDSLHWVYGQDIDMKQIELVQELLNYSFDTFSRSIGLDNHIFFMEFEKIYRKAFYGKVKKRYAGMITWKDGKPAEKLDIWGFEVKRSDSSQFSRNLQKKVFSMLLSEDKTKDETMSYIGNEIDRIRKGKFEFVEIGIPKGLTKDPMDYFKHSFDPNLPVWKQKGISSNIRGTLYSIKELGNELSTKPKMVYIKNMPDNFAPIDVLCFDNDSQVPPGTQIDVEKTLDKLVKSKLESIFDALGWKMSDLVYYWKGKPENKDGDQEPLFVLDDYGKKGSLIPIDGIFT